MANYKVSGIVTPSAKVIAYPHSSNVIYGTADAVGAYEIQWTAASAQMTRVVAYDGISDPQIHVLMPEEVTPPFNPNIYDIYYTPKLSYQAPNTNLLGSVGSGNNAFYNGANGGDGSGLQCGDSTTDVTYFGAGTPSPSFKHPILGDMTICARVTTPTAYTGISTIVNSGADGELESQNHAYLLRIKDGGATLSLFMEYGGGNNSEYQVPYTFNGGGQEYNIAATRTVTGSTCVVEFFVDGVSIGTSGSIPTATGGEVGDFTVGNSSINSSSSALGGTIKGLMVTSSVLDAQAQQDVFTSWETGTAQEHLFYYDGGTTNQGSLGGTLVSKSGSPSLTSSGISLTTTSDSVGVDPDISSSLPSTGDLYIEATVTVTSLIAGNNFIVAAFPDDSTGGTDLNALWSFALNGSDVIYFAERDSGVNIDGTFAAGITTGNTYNFVFGRSGTQVWVEVDGTEVGRLTLAPPTVNGDVEFRIGAPRDNDARSLVGEISRLTINDVEV